jgi:excisionase family DNA binding protein
MNNELLSIAEVAKRFHVSKSTIQRMINDRTLQAVQIGKQWRIYQESVENYLRTQEEKRRGCE